MCPVILDIKECTIKNNWTVGVWGMLEIGLCEGFKPKRVKNAFVVG